jgi:hypothetical protein
MNILKDPDSHPAIFKMLRMLNLGEFNSTYMSLASQFTRLRRLSQNQIAFTTPPGQTTAHKDPNRSEGSTSSTELKPELYAQNVALKFLEDTYSTIAKWMSSFEWIDSDSKLYCYPQYDAILSC